MLHAIVQLTRHQADPASSRISPDNSRSEYLWISSPRGHDSWFTTFDLLVVRHGVAGLGTWQADQKLEITGHRDQEREVR